jgi:NADH:ubiquinone reductase (H+-translocating)
VTSRRARAGTLVLGGGFAGTAVARTLGTGGATIVARDDRLVFTPLLPEAAAGELRLEHVSRPLRRICPSAEVVVGAAVALDTERRSVRVDTDAGAVELGYDDLVVAVGSVTRRPPIPGLAEHALDAKTEQDFVRLRAHVLGRLADAAAAEAGSDERRRCLTFVFVGGGYAGVETLAELQRLAHDVVRNYDGVGAESQRWLLVDAAPQILADIPGRLGAYAARELRSRGVEILTQTLLERLNAGEAVLSGGRHVETETLVWTAGVRPEPVVERLGLPLDERGRIRVEPTLRVEGHEHVWAVGDCARVPNAATAGRTDPPTSQHAQQQGRRLARNLLAARRGRGLLPYRYTALGQVATLGRYEGTADLLGLRLTGLAGWAASRAVHLLQLPDPLQRAGVASQWALSLLTRRDTVD